MKNSGISVAIIGASTLLGKELATVLEERAFPVSNLTTLEGDQGEPDLPILDLSTHSQFSADREKETTFDSDLIFVATPSERFRSWLRQDADAGQTSDRPPCTVIDLTTGGEEAEALPVRIPFLDRPDVGERDRQPGDATQIIASPHAATIMVSAMLTRLAARLPIQSAVAQVFSPASEIGARAIEELQKQTVNLLSFQKLPQKVFGAQIAFNLLPRLGNGTSAADRLEGRIRSQLQSYLKGRTPVPALRLFQVPVFYSMGLSLYVQMQEPAAPADVVALLEGKPLCIRRVSDKPPSQVEAAGSNDILVDAIQPDASNSAGIWLWAVADNLRLTALNAVQIAESLQRPHLRNLTL